MRYAPAKDWTDEWDKHGPQLLNALSRSPTSETQGDLFHWLNTEQARLWPGQDSSIVTLLVEDHVVIWLAGGQMAELQEMYEEIEKYYARLGVTKVVVSGRPGWMRSFLRQYKFRIKHVVMEKNL